MDKVIKVTIAIFALILAATCAFAGYSLFTENAYRASLNSTYSYSCLLETDETLTDVTFFIPVPASPGGNSPVVERISAAEVQGVPPDWTMILFDTGKATLLKITAPQIIVSGTRGSANSVRINITVNVQSPQTIDTRTPAEDDAVFRPVQSIKAITCPQEMLTGPGSPQCMEYLTAIYADYSASPSARVTITSQVVGRNDWKIFEPKYNEYDNRIDLLMFGENHGWQTARGWLESGAGSYDIPSSKK